MSETKDQAENTTQSVTFRMVGFGGGEKTALQKAVWGEDAIGPQALEPEDEFKQFYVSSTDDAKILPPPYPLDTLDRLCQENNTLAPCIEAMVTNVDGTGYDFTSADDVVEDNKDDEKIKALREFFMEPWPGESFVTIRQKLRRDLERVGNAYLEVLRNPKDEIVFIRHVSAKMIRLVELGDPVATEKKLIRNGKEVTVTVMERHRRYAQLVNGKALVYFKDFGVPLDLDKNTGKWADKGQRLPAKTRATEIIHFTCVPDSKTPYGVPRWISQLPSVLGSRKAEEFNLEFFDNGGIPPILIMLQGGMLQDETRKALEQKTSGPASKLNRVQIIEVEPVGGSLDHPTQARVTVERFGSDRMNDSMFENYDEKCESRIRRAFRLPPIFVGSAENYNYASAYVSCTLAEAQVFKPERDEFDEIVNMRLLPALGYTGYKMISKPLNIEDVQTKLQAIELSMNTGVVDMKDIVYEINEAAGTNIKVTDEPLYTLSQLTVDAMGNVVPGRMKTKPNGPVNANGVPQRTPAPSENAKKSEDLTVVDLAKEAMEAFRNRDFASLSKTLQLISRLDERGQHEFRKACATMRFLDVENDPDGLGELLGCTMEVMAHEHHAH